jgi:sugar phosphate isomerase/epimerase
MTVAMETMSASSIGGPVEEMKAILDGFDPARVGMCLDTGHVHCGGDPAAFAREMTGRIVTVHLHDNAGDRDAHALPGEGTIDWPVVLAAIRTAGYAGPWINEGAGPGLAPEAIVRSFVERMTARLPETG